MKKMTVLLLAAAMTMSLAGCGGSAEEAPAAAPEATEEAGTADSAGEDAAAPAASGEKGVVYGIYKAGDQTWFIDEGAAAQAAVEANGDEFIFVDAKMSPEEYLKAIDNAIANKAKGIVTCIPDQTMSQAVVDKCAEANLPIVAADDALQQEDGTKIAPWVGINAYVIGQANGDWLAAYAKDNNLVTDEECGLLIMTMDTVSSCVPRAEGEYDNFTAGCPNLIQHVFSKQIMTERLTKETLRQLQ